MRDLKCEICFERVNQPEEKHQGEVDQEKEAVSVLSALHEDCQLFGPGQQQSWILSLQNPLDQRTIGWQVPIEEILIRCQKEVKWKIYAERGAQAIVDEKVVF